MVEKWHRSGRSGLHYSGTGTRYWQVKGSGTRARRDPLEGVRGPVGREALAVRVNCVACRKAFASAQAAEGHFVATHAQEHEVPTTE